MTWRDEDQPVTVSYGGDPVEDVGVTCGCFLLVVLIIFIVGFILYAASLPPGGAQ